MITIVAYTTNPRTRLLQVEYEYAVVDTVANESIERRASVTIDETVPPLDKPDWTDEDLCVAVAQVLGVQGADVQMAAQEPR
jgi:hypothetical protein